MVGWNSAIFISVSARSSSLEPLRDNVSPWCSALLGRKGIEIDNWKFPGHLLLSLGTGRGCLAAPIPSLCPVTVNQMEVTLEIHQPCPPLVFHLGEVTLCGLLVLCTLNRSSLTWLHTGSHAQPFNLFLLGVWAGPCDHP